MFSAGKVSFKLKQEFKTPNKCIITGVLISLNALRW